MTATLQSNLTRPLALKQGSSEVSILVPADVWVAAEQLREEFLLSSTAESSAPAEEGAEDQAPEMALVARFLKFATDKSEQVNWWLYFSSPGGSTGYIGEFYSIWIRTLFFSARLSDDTSTAGPWIDTRSGMRRKRKDTNETPGTGQKGKGSWRGKKGSAKDAQEWILFLRSYLFFVPFSCLCASPTGSQSFFQKGKKS